MVPRLCLFLCALLLPVPAWAQAAAKRPFPQHTTYTDDVIHPSVSHEERDQAVSAFYPLWKRKYLRTGEPGQQYVFANAEKTDESPDTRALSEAQGYGMLISVLMAGADPEARENFDALYRYVRAHPSAASPDLMAWQQVYRDGKPDKKPGHDNAATDGDLDIALALLMAGRQWGNDGEFHYEAEGLKRAAAVLKFESNGQTLSLGSWVGEKGKYVGSIRTSDFMPSHFRTFLEASGNETWRVITNRMHAALASLVTRYAPETGLPPDFALLREKQYRPAPPRFLEGPGDGFYSYNACRVPWRLATDYLLTGDPRSLALLEPLNAWVRQATGDDPAKINAGYRLDGSPMAEDRSAAFLAPFAVAAMTDATPGSQLWLDALWHELVNRPDTEDAYYGNTIKLLALIVLSGNWWQ